MKKNLKEIVHPLLLGLMTLKRHEDLAIEGEMPEKRPVLIVANHLCINDIPALAEAVKDHFYLLVSDEDKNTFNGKMLELNGVKWVSRTDKKNRRESRDYMVDEITNGQTFAMYPESTWNLSPNLLMLPMNYGCIDIANASKVDILPVVTFFTDSKRYSKVGECYHPSDDLITSISELRDIMATMVFEQMEKYYQENSCKEHIHCMEVDGQPYYYEKRETVQNDYWSKYVEKKYQEYPRAKKDPSGVRKFESQFIFEPKTDAYAYFQIFNSVVKYDESGNLLVRRITSEKNGYQNMNVESCDSMFFGYGYNECNYKKVLKK